MKLIKTIYESEFKRKYFNLLNSLNEEEKLKKEIIYFLELLRKNFNFKDIININFKEIKRDENEFGKVRRNNCQEIEIFINKIINYKNNKNLDDELFVMDVLINTIFHEFYHCIQLYKINNKIINDENFIMYLDYQLFDLNKKYWLDYKDNPFEIETHRKTYLFMKELSILINKYEVCCKGHFYLENIYFCICNDFNYDKNNRYYYNLCDYILYEAYNENNIDFGNDLNSIGTMSILDHQKNIDRLFQLYLNSENKELLSKYYRHILVHEFIYFTLENLKNFMVKYKKNLEIYDLISDLYDNIINDYNKLYIKYRILLNIYNNNYKNLKFFINKKELINKYNMTCEYYLNMYDKFKMVIDIFK